MSLAELAPEALPDLSDEEFREKFAELAALASRDRQENALVYYRPVNPTAARVWESNARVLAIGGGNGSGQTEQMLALIIACATGVFPDSMKHLAGKLFRGPIHVRVVCESLTTVLYPVMLPKLQWWKWTGVDQPGGEKGHWGWIPPYCLKERQWEKSWVEKLRTLTVICRDPDDLNIVRGESVIQFTSFDQDPSDFASGDFHLVLHDEPPPLAIWRENEARTMRVAGRVLLSMTWPDDPSIPVDWIFDEVYEPGTQADQKDIEWINIYSTDNPHLNQDAVKLQAAKWSDETRQVRIYGRPIRFSNRVHPLFTDQTTHWCFPCGKAQVAEDNPKATGHYDTLICTSCRSTNVVAFNHVKDFSVSEKWPVVWLLDPHPRKPHRGIWVMVDPSDDLWQVDEVECDGDPTDMRKRVDEIEGRHGLFVAHRMMDPNMGASPSSSKRGVTWQSDFDDVGLTCELADDSAAGRKHVNQYLKPDERRLQPRIHIHPRCKKSISDFKRHVWDEYKRAAEKDQKQVPKPKNDDSCALWKYLLNYGPTFNGLKGMLAIYSRPGQRRGAY
jgi:phage terminase large subunit-like protein